MFTLADSSSYQELYIATQKDYRHRPLWIDGGGHNNLEALTLNENAIVNHLNAFLDAAGRY